MPILNSRYKFTKIFRPKGTRFAHGDCRFAGNTGLDIAASSAVAHAFNNFQKEFGRPPMRHHTLVIEISYSGSSAMATVYEIQNTVPQTSKS